MAKTTEESPSTLMWLVSGFRSRSQARVPVWVHNYCNLLEQRLTSMTITCEPLPQGGLGSALIKVIMDEIHYGTVDGANRLALFRARLATGQ
jgi:hypothetical protein